MVEDKISLWLKNAKCKLKSTWKVTDNIYYAQYFSEMYHRDMYCHFFFEKGEVKPMNLEWLGWYYR
jgi:hypothetical protein